MAAGHSVRRTGALCAWALVAPALVHAQAIPAFSGADGAAANVSGGRGGIVYHVTKLNSAIDDPQAHTLGTIRYGLNNANFPAGAPRTIVFDVGGVFHLGRLPQPVVGWDPNGNGWDPQSRLTIGGTNVTLAGQTAPGAGVIFMGGGLKPQGNNNIIRNITMAAGYGLTGWWKPGDPMRAVPGTPGAGTDASQWFPDNTVYDAMDISGTNIMIDHVSTLYGTDETISMNEVANNITVQYSTLAQGQNYPQWDAEGGGLKGHAYGSLLEAGNASAQAAISFHHNLYAHLIGRVPQMQTEVSGSLGAFYDFRNNVFYNWLGTAGSKSGVNSLNLVNNFYLAGDGGEVPIGGTNPGLTTQGGGTSVMGANSTIYRNGNLLDSNKDADADDGAPLSAGGASGPLWRAGVNTYAGVTDAPRDAFDRVLSYAGANWWNRNAAIDTPDERIINEARTGTGKIIAWADNPWNNDPNEGTEWRALRNTPQTSRPGDWDTEASIGYGVGDGMPSWWELAHGLDPSARDDAADFDSDGYTNVEEYLNEIAEWPAPQAIVFNGATNNRYAQITNWDIKWQPSRLDVAEVRTGVAVVDAVGQHAGTLRLAPTAGEAAALQVTAGWIEAAGALEVGLGGAGTVQHSGGVVIADQVTLGGGASAYGVYNLSGAGVLRVGTLDKPANEGEFNFTGGVLSADSVTFNLVNEGGMIAPGGSPGITHIEGDLTITSGSLLIELAGTSSGQFDEVIIDGTLTAGGSLAVILLDGYSPAPGATFDLLDFASASGAFTLQLPALNAGLAWDGTNLLTTGELAVVTATPSPNADFNEDGIIDGADLLTWQRGLGLDQQTSRVNGDANGDGAVDGEDLIVWQQQFGTTPQASPPSAAVPEPGTLWLAALAAVTAYACRIRRGCLMIAVGTVSSLAPAAPALAQQLAFPEAEGFGRFATGARTTLASATIYHVTNLNDSGAGSLRDALSQSNRFVVFDVGGIIPLNSVVTVASNITIAGQTAPGGIQVYGNRVAFHGANNLISRHWAVRGSSSMGREDAASLVRGTNMIWDHMSITWGVDGTFDINPDSGQVIDNLTIQNSVVGQGLDVVGHSTGGLMTLGDGHRFSIIKSLFTDNVTRNPKVRGENEFINNVVYGYETSGYIMGDTSATSHANVEGNYFIEGPVNGSSPFASGTPTFHIYANDNWVDGDRDGVLDGSLNSTYPGANVVGTRHAFPTTASMTAQQAVPYVMNNVGPNITRDAVDTRLVQEVASYGTLGGVIVRESDLFPNYGTGPQYLNSRARLADADGDAMPDNWETAQGLHPFNPADWKGLNGGYTRLEQFLNELGGNGATRTATGGAWTSAATWGGAVPTFADTAAVSGGLTHASGHAFARRLTVDGSSTTSGGTIDVFDTVLVGATGAGSLTMDGGVVSAGQVMIAAPGRTGSLTLNGGTLQTGTIASGGGAASLAWNGGTIRATGVPKITVPIALGFDVVTLDTNGFDGEISGAIIGTGGLNKVGAGKLRLSGANSIGFAVGISAGTLSIANSNSLGAAPLVVIAGGATLDATPAGGTVTALNNQYFTGSGRIQGNLVAAAGSVIQPEGAFTLQGQMLGVQAEAMTRGSDWAVFNSATHGAGNGGSYSGAGLNGGGVVLVANESLAAPTASGALTTTVNIPTAGGWQLFVRICEPTLSGVPGDSSTAAGGNNSFWTSASPASVAASVSNFKEVQTATTSPNLSHWSVVSSPLSLSGVVGSPIVPGIAYNLPAGPQTFTIYGREVGTIIDAFVLSTANLTAAQLDSALAGATEVGTTTLFSVTGNFIQQAESTLRIEIEEGDFSNALAVSGTASLAGKLEVAQMPGAMPLPTDQLTILTATNVSGTFAGVPNGARVLTTDGGSFQVNYASSNVRLSNFLAPIAADFDRNGVIDAADLGVWNAAMAAGTAAGDANGDGQTDGNDFLVWQRQLGSTVLGVAAASSAPEPTALVVLLGTAIGLPTARRRKRS